MNMNDWVRGAAGQHKAMPILSFPGIQITGTTVRELVQSAEKQATCMEAVAARFDLLASVSLMDLSVEAEAFGASIRYSDEEVPTVVGTILSSAEDLDALTQPEVGAGRTGTYVEAIRLAKQRITAQPVFAGSIGPFSLAGRLLDMTEIMVLCYEDPVFVHAVLERVTAFLIAYNRAFRDVGADGIVMAEPAAGLLSPALIAEFSTPYVRRIIEAVEMETCLFIYHNCGNTLPLLDSILETGARVLHFGNAVDLAEILHRLPADRLVLGNIDPARILRAGTPMSISTATRSLLEHCSKYPNFVLSSGCDIPPMTPLDNIDAFLKVAADFYR